MGCRLIKPKIGPNKGQEVESKLYNDLLNLTGSEKAADTAYTKVHTSEFLNWFGDWINNKGAVSKVVDENGEPLMVYHGTEKNFDVFKMREYGEQGLFFASSQDSAKYYGPNILPVFLNIKNPTTNYANQYDMEWWKSKEGQEYLKAGVEGKNYRYRDIDSSTASTAKEAWNIINWLFQTQRNFKFTKGCKIYRNGRSILFW